MLPPEAIKEYQRLYRERYGVDLSDAEASFRANNLVRLYRAVLGADGQRDGEQMANADNGED